MQPSQLLETFGISYLATSFFKSIKDISSKQSRNIFKEPKELYRKNLEQRQESRTTNLMTEKQKKKSLNVFKNALINASTCKKSKHPRESLNIGSFRELVDFSRLFENVAWKRYTPEHEHWTNMTLVLCSLRAEIIWRESHPKTTQTLHQYGLVLCSPRAGLIWRESCNLYSL